MSFIVRSARSEDVDELFHIANQFVLLNLPADKRVISNIVSLSQKSFSGQVDFSKTRFLFVCEEVDTGKVVGCSQIIGKKGTPENPNYSFKVIKKEKFSPNLSVGFIHQLLRLNLETDGGPEVGGLVVHADYRTRPEKIGKTLSLSRFIYMAMNLDKFNSTVLSEMAPPLSDDGRSEFWEALGRRFTGMPYQEADSLSQSNKDFIKSLFPEEDIYTCLLDAKARLVMGQVSQETIPALHMLKRIGFEYNQHIDPFDGGPHMEAKISDISIVKDGSLFEVNEGDKIFESRALVGHVLEGEFFAALLPCKIENNKIYLTSRDQQQLSVKTGMNVFATQL